MDIDYVAAYEEFGSHRKAASALGLAKTTFCERYHRQKNNQEHSDFLKKYKVRFTDPEEIIQPDEFVKKQTVHIGADGEVKNRWLKTDKTVQDAAEYLKNIAETLSEEIQPRKPVSLNPNIQHVESLMTLYTLADFHMGMYCNIHETGDTWNIEKAKQVFKDFIYHGSLAAPESAQAVLLNLGDMSHTDGLTPHTTSRKHALDVSGRFNEIQDAIVECFDYAITLLLRRHKRVHVIYCAGNHDRHTAPLIRDMIARAYANNERVTFDQTGKVYHEYQWGQTAIFAHHGDKRNLKQQAETYTMTFPKTYGETKYRYGFTGHRHHDELAGKETFGIRMRQCYKLAPLDSHAAEHGYFNEARADVRVFHKDYGERFKYTLTTEELLG